MTISGPSNQDLFNLTCTPSLHHLEVKASEGGHLVRDPSDAKKVICAPERADMPQHQTSSHVWCKNTPTEEDEDMSTKAKLQA
jgi:hypothetical protein